MRSTSTSTAPGGSVVDVPESASGIDPHVASGVHHDLLHRGVGQQFVEHAQTADLAVDAPCDRLLHARGPAAGRRGGRRPGRRRRGRGAPGRRRRDQAALRRALVTFRGRCDRRRPASTARRTAGSHGTTAAPAAEDVGDVGGRDRVARLVDEHDPRRPHRPGRGALDGHVAGAQDQQVLVARVDQRRRCVTRARIDHGHARVADEVRSQVPPPTVGRAAAFTAGQQAQTLGDVEGEHLECIGGDVPPGRHPVAHTRAGRCRDAERDRGIAGQVDEERAVGSEASPTEGERGGDDGRATAALDGPTGDEHDNPPGTTDQGVRPHRRNAGDRTDTGGRHQHARGRSARPVAALCVGPTCRGLCAHAAARGHRSAGACAAEPATEPSVEADLVRQRSPAR